MIVYNLEDLKKEYNERAHGRIGMWGFHAKLHDGHKQCGRIARENCDFVICFYWQNFGEGMRLLVGDSVDSDNPFSIEMANEAKQFSDLVMVFKDDYHPYLSYKKEISDIMDKEFPEELLIEKGVRYEINLYGSLVYSVAVRFLIHNVYSIKVHYHPTCGRERWKMVGYPEWLEKEFGITYDLLDDWICTRRNVISGMRNKLPPEIFNRVHKKLLLPHFKSREDVEEHIKDIEGLHVGYFFREKGWIQCKFYFEPHQWWAEGLKLEEE